MPEKPRNRPRGQIAVLAALALAVASVLPITAGAQAARSAQGDCAREANRRGYQVQRTGDFRQVSDGWQMELTLRNSQGRSDDGICTVRTSTGQVSFTGFDFGTGSDGAVQFDCLSDGSQYQECQLPVDGRARLLRRYSRVPCQEGYSWGQRGDRVWVNRGCRARFEVDRGYSGGPSLDCRSTDGRYRECRLAGGGNVQLVRVYSGNCRKDSTWGVRPGLVWVTAGCQAQFTTTGGGDGSNAVQQRAEAACRVEAQRQYISVRSMTPARNQGSYWQALIAGSLRNQPVQADCRYDPRSNKASIFVGAGGGSELKVRAEKACMAHAARLGYTVYGQSAAQSAGNALRVALKLKQGNQLFAAECYYDSFTGRTRLEQLRPQPR